AVAKLLTSFTNSISVTTAGDIVGASGTAAATAHQSGDFQITSDGASPANLTSTFTPNGGSPQAGSPGTISFPSGTNTTLIPGVTLTGAAAPGGATSVLHLAVATEGIAQSINDYLKQALGLTGLFKSRSDSTGTQVTTINHEIDAFQKRLDSERQALERKFLAMERALGLLQQQSAGLTNQLNALSNQQNSSH
ncbi:MAG TPA: flagellar filament capping protein FliD, partial [Chloroflexota bacterium]